METKLCKNMALKTLWKMEHDYAHDCVYSHLLQREQIIYINDILISFTKSLFLEHLLEWPH